MLSHSGFLEQGTGIEPAFTAWEAYEVNLNIFSKFRKNGCHQLFFVFLSFAVSKIFNDFIRFSKIIV